MVIVRVSSLLAIKGRISLTKLFQSSDCFNLLLVLLSKNGFFLARRTAGPTGPLARRETSKDLTPLLWGKKRPFFIRIAFLFIQGNGITFAVHRGFSPLGNERNLRRQRIAARNIGRDSRIVIARVSSLLARQGKNRTLFPFSSELLT